MKNKIRKRIIVAMSGGVDSSVAAKLLADAGHEVVGVFLHFWKDDKAGEAENKCCSAKALLDARRVCRKIGIPLYTLNFSEIFKEEVVDNFLFEYSRGRTPNPCIRCNKLVKLGLLIKRAKEMGFDCVASGHYACLRQEILNSKFPRPRRAKRGGQIPKYKLFRGKDKDKDQSYFLYTLSQAELSRLLFPVGAYRKDEVRKLAKKFKLPVAEKKESQEICFIPGKSHNDFLKRYLKLKKGKIKTLDNKIIGEHEGLPLYTIGQRKGLEIGGTGPYYAARMDYKTNTLYVVSDGDDPVLYRDELVAKEVSWIAGREPKMPLICQAVVRYQHKGVKCRVKNIEGKINTYKVKFKEPQRAITPGQSVAFYGIRRRSTNAAHPNEYNEDEVLGGGVISN